MVSAIPREPMCIIGMTVNIRKKSVGVRMNINRTGIKEFSHILNALEYELQIVKKKLEFQVVFVKE